MNFKIGNLEYEWQANWGNFEEAPAFSHHGLQCVENGDIISGHTEKACILRLNQDGKVVNSFDLPIAESHGISSSKEDGEEYIWVIDVGSKSIPQKKTESQILKCNAQGEIVQTIRQSNLPAEYQEQKFTPTTVTIDPITHNIWIADGYGSSYVHCLDKNLNWIKTLDGTEGAGRFSCPHWVYIDTRTESPKLYVADRSNHRVQIFDTEGKYLNSISEGFRHPSAFTSFDEYLVVAELDARIAILDKDDKIIGYIGDGETHLSKEGWPNRLNDNKERISPLPDIPEGEFNSPHGITADAQGNIYISEWLIGGRYIKLKRITS